MLYDENSNPITQPEPVETTGLSQEIVLHVPRSREEVAEFQR